MSERSENIKFINKTLLEEGGHLRFNEVFKYGSSNLELTDVTNKQINYIYDGSKGKSNLTYINEDIIGLMVKAIKEQKFL